MRSRGVACGLALAALLSAWSVPAWPADDPFRLLGAAYATRDAEAAAAAYADEAEVVYRYAGAEPERHHGRPAIMASFRSFFASLAPADPLHLEFRFLRRDEAGARGFYRLRVGESVHYGRFEVTFSKDGRFLTDTSSDALREDFEAVPMR